jgi:hypothetical protein
MKFKVLDDRAGQVIRTSKQGAVEVTCNKASAAGSVSQRACTFCGSRVVLYPIADAFTWSTAPWAAPPTPGIFAAPCRRGQSFIASVVRRICANEKSFSAAKSGWNNRCAA